MLVSREIAPLAREWWGVQVHNYLVVPELKRQWDEVSKPVVRNQLKGDTRL